MSKLNANFTFDLTPEQYESASEWLAQLGLEGGMLLGSVKSYRGDDLSISYRAGFRWVDVATAEKLVELANAQGENEDA